MGNRLNTYGNVMISTPTDVFTVKDIRDFLEVLDLLGVPDSKILDDGFLVYEHQTENVQVTNCANHDSNENVLDFVISTHECNE